MKSEVFNQSTCIVSTVAYQYYVEKKSRAEITEELGLSSATISRLLKKAKEDGIVEFRITEPYFSCHKMEEQLKEMYDLDNVMIVPVIEKEAKENSETIKKTGGAGRRTLCSEDHHRRRCAGAYLGRHHVPYDSTCAVLLS